MKILEKMERLGGKSHTIVDKDGVPHEMGTCYLHPGYEEIRDLVQVSCAGFSLLAIFELSNSLVARLY